MRANNLIENRIIRVFISSTFRDMQDERDELMKKTFPMLRRKAEERDVTLTELDLRWGITPEESESEKVVEICLREVENSVPFFIGIIGNRYGWIPSAGDIGKSLKERFRQVERYVERQLSVTEMEMQFGVLERPEDMHAYFFIKDQEADEVDEPEKLSALKAAVRSNGRYPVSSYSSPEDLALQVEEAFTKLMDDLFPEGALSELEKERIGQLAYLNSLSLNYIRTNANFAVIDEWMSDWDKHQLVITGASGLGKSALVANWVKEKLASGDGLPYRIVYHFVGNGGSLGSHGHVIKALCNEIRNCYGFDIDEINTQADEKVLEELFYKVAAPGNKPLLIVLDAINQIIDTDNSKQLNWLPIPPKNVKILFTTLEDDQTMAVFKNRNYPIFSLKPLTKTQRGKMVRQYLGKFAKKLQPHQVERIISDKQCKNTLVLKALLDELVNFGNYEKLDEKIDTYLGASSVEDFYDILLNCYEADFGDYLVRHILSLIAVSRNGLSEEDVLSITKETPLHWSQFFCAIHQHLIVKDGLISYAHTYISKAVESRYLEGKKEWEKSCREKIVLHINNSEASRSMDEIPYQYAAMGLSSNLHTWLMHLQHSIYLCDKNPIEIGSYWKKLIKAGFSLSDYRERLRLSPEYKYYISLISLCIEYFSDLKAAKELCQDFHSLLRRKGLLSGEDAEKLFIWEGIIQRSESHYDSALNSFNAALGIMMRNHGDNHFNTSFALKHIGTIYNLTHKYEKAEEYYLKALSIQQNTKHKKESIDTLHSLGDNCLDAKQPVRAEKFLNEALSSAIELIGEESCTVSSLYNSLGALYDDLEDYKRAIEYYHKSISFDERMLGNQHVNIAHSYHNLGGTYYRLGELDNAEKCYLKALQIKRNLFGEENYETALTSAGLGNVKRAKGEHKEAAVLHKKYLDAYTQTIGTHSDYLAVILCGIGEDYYQMEDYDTALSYHLRALNAISETSGFIPSPYFNAIGNDLFGMDRFTEAISYYQKGLDAAIAQTDEYAQSVLYYSIGNSYGFLGEFIKAKDMFEKSLDIRERILPSGDPRTERCREMLMKAKHASKVR